MFSPDLVRFEEQFTNAFDSDISTRDTIALMKAWALRSVDSRELCRALDKIRLEQVASEEAKVEKIFYWIKRNVRFIPDEESNRNLGLSNPDYKELLIDPRVIAAAIDKGKLAFGDCDDFSMLAAGLIKTALPSVPVWFTTIATDAATPNRWSHVYLTVAVDGKLVAFDASHGDYLGWEAENNGYQVFRKEFWRVESE